MTSIKHNIDNHDSSNEHSDNKKCAPNLDFENGSCIPLYVLIDMATAYNKYNKSNKLNNKIYLNDDMDITDPDEYKNYLIKEFKQRFSGNQQEWIKLKFTELMSDENKMFLHSSTFRPNGPKGKFDWLSTLDINKVLFQYENKYDDFKFLGAVPIDFYDLTNLNIFANEKKYTFKNIDFNECMKNGINR